MKHSCHRLIVVFLFFFSTSHAQNIFVVESHSPDKNAHNLSPATTVLIRFNSPIDTKKLPERPVTISGDVAGFYAYNVSFSENNRTLVVTPLAPFREGENVHITLRSDILDTYGDELGRPHTFAFSIATRSSEMMFYKADSIPLNSLPSPIILGSYDLNTDGLLDFVIGSGRDITGEDETKIAILRARSESLGDFLIEEKHAGIETCCFLLAPFDHDHKADLIALDFLGDKLTFLRGEGGNSFEDAATLADLTRPLYGDQTDYDGDGDMDFAIAATNGVYLFTNRGDATFEEQRLDSAVYARFVVWNDVNNDGFIDLTTSGIVNGGVFLGVYLGLGSGVFSEPVLSRIQDYSIFVQHQDVDGDGDLDACLVQPPFRDIVNYPEYRGQIEILLNDGTGSFFPNQGLTSYGNIPVILDCADLDGDADIDLVWTNSGPDSNPDSTLVIALNDGKGEFGFHQKLVPGQLPKGVRCIDLNRDGKMDLAVITERPPMLHFYLADQTSSTPSTPLPEQISLVTYPNPFHDRLSIRLESPEGGKGEFSVFDLMGRRVFSQSLNLHNGTNNYAWNGADLQGRALPSGIYWARFLNGDKSVSRKIALLR